MGIKNWEWGRLGGSVGYTSAFGSGHDPRVPEWNPTLGSLLGRESASPSPSAPPSVCVFSLSLINKQNEKNKVTSIAFGVCMLRGEEEKSTYVRS